MPNVDFHFTSCKEICKKYVVTRQCQNLSFEAQIRISKVSSKIPSLSEDIYKMYTERPQNAIFPRSERHALQYFQIFQKDFTPIVLNHHPLLRLYGYSLKISSTLFMLTFSPFFNSIGFFYKPSYCTMKNDRGRKNSLLVIFLTLLFWFFMRENIFILVFIII